MEAQETMNTQGKTQCRNQLQAHLSVQRLQDLFDDIKYVVGCWNIVDDKSLLGDTFLDKSDIDPLCVLMSNDVTDSSPKR